jgi:hypothetical protein
VIEWGAFVGSRTEVRMDVKGHKLIVDVSPDVGCPVGGSLRVYVSHDDTIFLPMD